MIFQAKLLHLYLDHNSIEDLSGETLFGLESLEYLSLSHNSLVQLPANLTHYAPNIKTLGIRSHFCLHLISLQLCFNEFDNIYVTFLKVY